MSHDGRVRAEDERVGARALRQLAHGTVLRQLRLELGFRVDTLAVPPLVEGATCGDDGVAITLGDAECLGDAVLLDALLALAQQQLPLFVAAGQVRGQVGDEPVADARDAPFGLLAEGVQALRAPAAELHLVHAHALARGGVIAFEVADGDDDSGVDPVILNELADDGESGECATSHEPIAATHIVEGVPFVLVDRPVRADEAHDGALRALARSVEPAADRRADVARRRRPERIVALHQVRERGANPVVGGHDGQHALVLLDPIARDLDEVQADLAPRVANEVRERRRVQEAIDELQRVAGRVDVVPGLRDDLAGRIALRLPGRVLQHRRVVAFAQLPAEAEVARDEVPGRGGVGVVVVVPVAVLAQPLLAALASADAHGRRRASSHLRVFSADAFHGALPPHECTQQVLACVVNCECSTLSADLHAELL